MFKLNSSRIGRAIGDGAQVFGAILSAASAVRNHRRPENRGGRRSPEPAGAGASGATRTFGRRRPPFGLPAATACWAVWVSTPSSAATATTRSQGAWGRIR